MKKRLLFAAKLLVSSLLIWYLFSRADLSGVLSAIVMANVFWLAGALFTIYLGKVFTGYRWQVLLAAQDVHIPLRTLIASVFVGQFFNNFLPTTFGGDAARAYDTAVYSKQPAKSLTSLFLDRLIGVLALALLALVGLLAGFLAHQDVLFYVGPVLGVFIFCAGIIGVVFTPAAAKLFERLLEKIGLKKAAGMVREITGSMDQIRRDRKVLLIAFLVSLALQVNVVLFYYMIGRALAVDISMLYYFILVPIALVISTIPFSINGIGLREGIFVFLLNQLAVPAETAIALSLISFGLLLTQGVVGGIIFALRGTNLSRLLHKRTT
ncbi:MAG: flippase-like domain-containing protein [Chloroflexi bacterium]|mgnify:CR=1 FL=1|nr:flippase-like domain-containing protein [Chloroflexota bacterium]